MDGHTTTVLAELFVRRNSSSLSRDPPISVRIFLYPELAVAGIVAVAARNVVAGIVVVGHRAIRQSSFVGV